MDREQVAYEQRGRQHLISGTLTAANGLFLMFFGGTRTVGVSQLMIAVIYLFKYLFWRKMPPEQYRERWKSDSFEKLSHRVYSKRETEIHGRAAQAAVGVMMFSLVVGWEISLLIFDNPPVAWTMAALFAILIVSLFAASAYYKRKP